MRRIIVILATVLALAASACTSSDSTPGDTTPDGVPFIPTGGEGIFAQGVIEPFDSCNDFLAYVKTHAKELVGPYGLEGWGGYVWARGDAFMEVAESLDAGADGSANFAGPPTTTEASGGVEYSETNVQVEGVDEPDIVKTDGERIFVVAQGQLHWIDVTGTPEVVASLQLDGWGQQLFLSDDRLLVLTSGHDMIAPAVDFAGDVAHYQSPRVVLAEVDVSNPDSFEVRRTLTMDGSTVASRMIDDTVRLVVRSGPTGFDWAYPEGSGIRAEQEATEKNKELIDESTIENWVPWYVLEDEVNGTTSDGALLGCSQVGHPDEFSGLSMLNVLSIGLGSGLEPGNGIGLLAEGQTVYSSSDSLYVATAPWSVWTARQWDDRKNDTLKTQIHVFDITDPSTARYAGSGEVDGVLQSQWSMDEYEGTLRVVTTDAHPWWGSSEVPESSVITMQLLGDELVQIGSVSGLGKNEHVYAVRFIEDKGYVVTFRQIDPLYVVDLSDPRDPTVEGELKINGYSAYLHPIGEDLLLGVGQDATDEGRVVGTQVSVFDVSDPTDPRRMARLTFEDGWSDAEWDTHAFLWWASDGIAVMPLQRWSWDDETDKEDHFSGAVVVSATDSKVTQVAQIEHPGFEDPDCPECWAWTAPIVRSVVIGDTLFTISETGILASSMDDFDTMSWLEF